MPSFGEATEAGSDQQSLARVGRAPKRAARPRGGAMLTSKRPSAGESRGAASRLPACPRPPAAGLRRRSGTCPATATIAARRSAARIWRPTRPGELPGCDGNRLCAPPATGSPRNMQAPAEFAHGRGSRAGAWTAASDSGTTRLPAGSRSAAAGRAGPRRARFGCVLPRAGPEARTRAHALASELPSRKKTRLSVARHDCPERQPPARSYGAGGVGRPSRTGARITAGVADPSTAKSFSSRSAKPAAAPARAEPWRARRSDLASAS